MGKPITCQAKETSTFTRAVKPLPNSTTARPESSPKTMLLPPLPSPIPVPEPTERDAGVDEVLGKTFKYSNEQVTDYSTSVSRDLKTLERDIHLANARCPEHVAYEGKYIAMCNQCVRNYLHYR